jgi:hypothetical protein
MHAAVQKGLTSGFKRDQRGMARGQYLPFQDLAALVETIFV